MEVVPRILFTKGGNNKELYEFIAFICWYTFLILCCIIPTGCAYRRRRRNRLINEIQSTASQSNRQGIEANSEDALDDLSFVIFQNFEIGNEIRRRRENAQQRRLEAKRNCLALKMSSTKWTIESINLLKSEGEKTKCKDELKDNYLDVEIGTTEHDNIQPVDTNSHEDKNEPQSKAEPIQKDNNDDIHINPIKYINDEVPFVLSLPELNEAGIAFANGGPRTVSDTCAICLCQYEEGDIIVWSPNSNCQHAFHEDCILTWLTKKDDPLCPFCCQNFV